MAWSVVRVASGNFLEMYDFMVFGYFAAAIGKRLLPSDNELGTLLKSLATFGIGFFMRPLGATCARRLYRPPWQAGRTAP